MRKRSKYFFFSCLHQFMGVVLLLLINGTTKDTEQLQKLKNVMI